MSRKRTAPKVLATTALMLLRNRLNERVWGNYGVNTLALDDPTTRPIGSKGTLADHRYFRWRRNTIILPEALPDPPDPITKSDLIRGVGIIGDSISDEYRFYAPDRVTARNWVEILAATRGFYFGDPVVRNGKASEDRRFSLNWSHSGATTTSLIARGQHVGLASQGAAIKLAVVTIGTNDFADVLISSKSAADMRQALEQVSANFALIFETLLAIDPKLKVAVFTPVDLRSSPLLRGALELGLISQPVADAYGRAIAEFNEVLRGMIARHEDRMVMVDINQLLQSIVETPRYRIGDFEIDNITASNDPRHLFLSDGFHPGTIGQSLIANRFLDAINSKFDTAIAPLGSDEIVKIATSVPKPSGLSLISTGVLALFGYGRRRYRAA